MSMALSMTVVEGRSREKLLDMITTVVNKVTFSVHFSLTKFTFWGKVDFFTES